MKSLWDDDARRELFARIERIEAGTMPKWGKMTAEKMLHHLAQSVAMSVGELDTKSKMLPIRFFPLKQLILYVFPFPKGSPTAPELLAGEARPVGAAKEELRRLLAKFVDRGESAQWPTHPAFGRLTGAAWGKLSYKHFDHHLRQFGV